MWGTCNLSQYSFYLLPVKNRNFHNVVLLACLPAYNHWSNAQWTKHDMEQQMQKEKLLCYIRFEAGTPFSMKMSQVITWEQSWGSQNLTSDGLLQTWNKYSLWCLCLMAPERILPPTSVRRALLSQVTLMGCPLSLALLWHGNGRQRPLWGEERDLCAVYCSQALFRCTKDPKPPNVQCTEQYSPVPQSVWDKGDVLQFPPFCWCCLTDALIHSDQLGNTFTLKKHAFHDNSVKLDALQVNQCSQAIAAMVKKKEVLPEWIIQKE